MKAMIYKIPLQAIRTMAQSAGLPSDAKILSGYLDLQADTFEFLAQSDNFPDVPDGKPINKIAVDFSLTSQ